MSERDALQQYDRVVVRGIHIVGNNATDLVNSILQHMVSVSVSSAEVSPTFPNPIMCCPVRSVDALPIGMLVLLALELEIGLRHWVNYKKALLYSKKVRMSQMG